MNKSKWNAAIAFTFFIVVFVFLSHPFLTKSEFVRIEKGMDEIDVVKILGEEGRERPQMVGRFGEVCKEWKRENYYIRVMVGQNGRVVQKYLVTGTDIE